MRSAISAATWASRNSCCGHLVGEARAPRGATGARSNSWRSSLMRHSVPLPPWPLPALSWPSMAMSEAGSSAESPRDARGARPAPRLRALRGMLALAGRSAAAAGLHRLPDARSAATGSSVATAGPDRLHRPSASASGSACRCPTTPASPSLSAAAIADPPVYDRARAAARYSSTMRDLIQSFKYGDRHEGLPLFGRWLAAAGAELLADADLIVPVPLYRSRLWSRRFNQSALLARAVGQAERFSGRLLPAREGQAHGEPGRAHGGAAATERRRRLSGDRRAKGAQGQAHRRRRRRDHHRRHGGSLRADAEAGGGGAGRCAGARARRGTLRLPAIV